MRSAIAMAAIVTFAAGTAFAQQEAPPSELGAAQHPPVHVETAPLATAAAPKLPDATPVINSEEQARAKIESEGFTDVSALKKNDRGMWTATAMKDGKPVQLSLNEEGQLSVLN